MSLLDYLFDEEDGLATNPDLQITSGPDMSLWSSRPAPNQDANVAALARRVGQLNLVVAALVRHTVKQGIVKPAELSALMREIDLEDGRVDGELNERRPITPEWCPKCQAKTAPNKSYCMFCGHPFDQGAANPSS
jgi:hypothetical protein